jgi:GAF domain-containing protein/tetratricopeptide (TPR) repeat protein
MSPSDARSAAERARAAREWEAAVSFYNRALDEGGFAPGEAYELLSGRAACRRMLGDSAAEAENLQAMEALAREMGDAPRLITALNRQVHPLVQTGRLAQALKAGESALTLARQLGEPNLEVSSLLSLAHASEMMGERAQGWEYARQALQMANAHHDLAGQARSWWLLGIISPYVGQTADRENYFRQALDAFRWLGDREEEGNALNALGIASVDTAVQRGCYEQALAAFEAVGNQGRLHMVYNNLALTYWRLGLYRRACEYAERAAGFARQKGARSMVGYYLETLGRAYLGQGQPAKARASFEEGRAIAQEMGDPWLESAYCLGLGLLAIAEDPAKACELLRTALDLGGASSTQSDQASAWAWLGAACLGLGDAEAARQHTASAAACLEVAGDVASEYPQQDVWWWRARALASWPTGETAPPLPDDAWHALDRARAAMVDAVAALSDNGLRRNYFGKVEINRQIVITWLAEAQRRGLPLAPLTDALAGRASVQDQVQRMLEIGVRLNTRRDAEELPHSVMDEIVELTGAGRAALFLVDAEGRRHVAALAGGSDAWLRGIAGLVDEAGQKHATLLRYLPPEAPDLEQTSTLCAPLLTQGRLIGLICVELPGTSGRFNAGDRDLLRILANQAAVALENAAWAGRLEQRVEERTAELQAANKRLEQRTAELQIINSVQHGLAAQLDMSAMYELVGEKIGSLFDAQVISIVTYDHARRLSCRRYGIERGQRFHDEPSPFSRLAEYLIATGQPVLINKDAPQRFLELGMTVVPGTEHPKSLLYVPLVTGNQVTGVISIQNLERENAFGDSDVQLLTTLANGMSIALENARLFGETVRLLTETQQRTTELEIINQAGVALARQLDANAIIGLIGSGLKQVFRGQMCSIALYDRDSNVITWPYFSGFNGEQIPQEPVELGPGLTSHVIRTR